MCIDEAEEAISFVQRPGKDGVSFACSSLVQSHGPLRGQRKIATTTYSPFVMQETQQETTKNHDSRKDPMIDVPSLIESFQSSGHIVPLGVHVAEVQALQQAATRLKVSSETCANQLQQLEERKSLVRNEQRAALEAKQLGLTKKKEWCDRSHQMLIEQFVNKRDSGIERFVPLLRDTMPRLAKTYGYDIIGDESGHCTSLISNDREPEPTTRLGKAAKRPWIIHQL